MYDYDMLVIGSGPSGRRAAVQFAKLGKSVLVGEKGRRVGGVSVHTGTIPCKTLRETVLNLSGWRERGFYGRSYRVKQDIAANDLIVRLQKTLYHEVEVLEHQFSRNLVRTAAGEARFVGPHQIEITAANGETRIVSAANILIACGTRPFRPAFILVSWSNPKVEAAFLQRARACSDVLECHHITGAWNYLLKVRVGTTRDLERFLTETIKAVDGVERTETLITLSSAKETWQVSLAAEPERPS
jgi:DNA-binding Lrp family transcriptional regulator